MNFFENSVVVVPFDFSDQARTAVEHTIDWVDSATIVHVIHVVESSLLVSMDIAAPIPPLYDNEQQELLLQQMQKLFQGDRYRNVKLHCLIGDPGSEIVDLARSTHARIIIMPSHGRTGLSRLLLGSVAERVLRLANCPVLVLRGEPSDDETSPAEVPAAASGDR
jgi:nucleotide-binding universal stress UspA family protein